MTDDGGFRASDSDREKVVEVLRAAYTEGRLDLGEFDERTTTAYAAKTWAELRALTSDLPSGVHLALPRPTTKPEPDSMALSPAPDSEPPWEPRRRVAAIPVLPLAIMCIVIAGAGHSAALLVPAALMIFLWVRLAGGHRHHHHRQQGPGDSPPGGGSGPL